MPSAIDLTGKQFHRWTVLSLEKRQSKNRRWICKCSCGVLKSVAANSLIHGRSQSCGCIRIERLKKRQTTHGQSRTREYKIWKGMLNRCRNKNDPNFPYYGERGITVDDRWKASFPCFIEDMGKAPTILHTIDRLDNDGNYEKSNCVWATRAAQSANRRTNRFLPFQGETLPLQEWSRRFGINRKTISDRIDKFGWSIEKALTTIPRTTSK